MIEFRRGYHRCGRRGGGCCAFTLLEVVLALAILAMCLAALGEVLRLAGENSSYTRDMTQAHLIASTKLAEFTSGAAALAPINDAAVEDNPDWRYSVEINNTAEIGLVEVRVTVRQDLPENQEPAEFWIVRWMPDPTLITTSSSGSASGSAGGGMSSGGTSGGTR